MSFKKIFDVANDHQLVIQLPEDFPAEKKVMVTVEEIPTSQQDKMKMMKRAVTDSLFLSDMNEVNNDFDLILSAS